MSLEGTLLSKRKIAKLITTKFVRDWDDPRLFTLVGLRRRGIPPGAILSFVNELGVSTAVTKIQIARFETCVRRYLEQTVPRLMLLLDPIPVRIENLPEDHFEEIDLPFSPKKPEFGQHTVPFTRTIYIDRSDFKEVDSKDYFRLAPGKSVGLFKVPFPIRATSFSTDSSTGEVAEIRAVYEKPEEGSTMKKPKAYIQWVAASAKHGSPVKVEARLFNPLILSKNVKEVQPTDTLLDGPKEEEGNDEEGDGEEGTGAEHDHETIPTGQSAAAAAAPSKIDRHETQKAAVADAALDAKQRQATDEPSEQKSNSKSKKDKKAKKKEEQEVFVQIVNPHSEEIYPNAMIETGFEEIRRRAPWPEKEGEKDLGASAGPETVRFQGMRVAYFAMDKDSEDGKIVLNRIVGLKEDAGK